MSKWGFIGLLAIPILEITLFVVIGGAIGVLATFTIILGTFFLGVLILQRQNHAQTAAKTHKDAVVFIAHQILVFFAAVCLILPGFFTDLVGLLLLIRPLRGFMIGLVTASVLAKFGDLAKRGGMTPRGDVLDGDYVDITPKSYPAVNNQDH
jgi:UPF0716 protein FxsA